jgi:Domain of unknown function (DUF5666)
MVSAVAGVERRLEMKRQNIREVLLVTSVAALLLAAWAPAKLAAHPVPQNDSTNFTLEGKISDQSPGKLTVDTGGQMIFHVTYDKNTTIHKKDGSAGTSSDLVAGAKVKVDGALNNSGVVEAREIDLE